MKRFTPLTALAATACLLGGAACQAGGSLLWYDGFSLSGDGGDYDPGIPGDTVAPRLSGQSGGSGSFFSGNWIGGADNATNGDQDALVYDTGLDRPGLTAPVTGGSTGKENLFDCCVFSRNSRLFSTPWGGFTDPDGTFYFGFLVDFGTGVDIDSHHRVVEFHTGGLDDEPNRTLMFGLSNFAGIGSSLGLSVDNAASEQTVDVDPRDISVGDLAVQGTHYAVLKFEMSTTGEDTVSAFLDPVGDIEPAPDMTVTVDQFLADRMSNLVQFTFTGGEATNAGGFFDELRVGTTWADVNINTLAYVPEPTSAALMAMVAGVAAMRRRG